LTSSTIDMLPNNSLVRVRGMVGPISLYFFEFAIECILFLS
jgi:hypothetical protein